MSSQSPTPETTQDSQRLLTLINLLLLSGMFSSLAFVTNQFIGVFYVEWMVTGLPVLTFFIALASLLAHYIQTRIIRHGINPFASVAAEWVLILLIGKIFLMVQPGVGGVWQEVLTWQHSFLDEFFDIQTILLIFFLLVIWGLTRLFSPPLFQLEEDQELMEQEKLGITFNDRQEARRSLMGLVFVLGFIMVGMTVIIKGNFNYLAITTTPTRSFVIALLVYFSLAFIFLALNHYAIQKARWYFNDIQVSPELAKRWLLYTVVFIAIAILLTAFLPTDFAFGFLPVAQTLFTVLVYIFGLIQFLVLLPISFVLSLLGTLIGTPQNESMPQPQLPEFSPETVQTSGTLPWWDLVKSILFWLIFVGVIILAIRTFINNHQGLKSFFEKLKIRLWLSDFWQWIKQGLKKVGAAATETVQKGVQQIRSYFSEREIKLPNLSTLIRHLPPRQALILTYLDWVNWNAKHGLQRKKSQTPYEYAAAIHQQWPDLDADLTPFTNDFIAARYTRQEIYKAQLEEAQALLSKLKAAILEQQSQTS
ncbi:MAG: DUF4129 domain-containing protein [Anaerolineaceae bacterium]|nr:DUF4129 domain-containing protein [Anaerolineaceae bacterium]